MRQAVSWRSASSKLNGSPSRQHPCQITTATDGHNAPATGADSEQKRAKENRQSHRGEMRPMDQGAADADTFRVKNWRRIQGSLTARCHRRPRCSRVCRRKGRGGLHWCLRRVAKALIITGELRTTRHIATTFSMRKQACPHALGEQQQQHGNDTSDAHQRDLREIGVHRRTDYSVKPSAVTWRSKLRQRRSMASSGSSSMRLSRMREA